MKDYNFKIKVGDLLQESSLKDSISFVNKFSTSLPQLTQEWISVDMIVQWMDRHSILLYIEKAKAPMYTWCDTCGCKIEHILTIQDEEVVCCFEKNIDTTEKEMIFIHEKESVIDIEEWLINSLLLMSPVVYLCKDCQNKKSWEEDSSLQHSTIKRVSTKK